MKMYGGEKLGFRRDSIRDGSHPYSSRIPTSHIYIYIYQTTVYGVALLVTMMLVTMIT